MTKQEEYRKQKTDQKDARNNASTLSSQRQFSNKGDLDSITGPKGLGTNKNLKMLGNVGMFVSNLKGKVGENKRGEIRRQSIDKIVDEFDIDKVCQTDKKPTNTSANQKTSLNKMAHNKSGKQLAQKPANLGI